jgi:hypothetical protein
MNLGQWKKSKKPSNPNKEVIYYKYVTVYPKQAHKNLIKHKFRFGNVIVIKCST